MADDPRDVELPAHEAPHPDVAGYLLGTLEGAEADAFARHLEGCRACRMETGLLGDLPALLADVPPPLALPAGLEDRTFAAVEAAALVPSPVVVATTAGVAGQGDSQGAGRRGRPGRPARDWPARLRPHGQSHGRSHGQSHGQSHGRPLGWPLAALAAAAVVVVVGVAAFASLRRGSPSPLATVRLIAADGGLARATATIRTASDGITIDMTVQDLPPTPSGKIYTCWLVANDDTLSRPDRVSVGTFVVHQPMGEVQVHWTSGADLRRFPHLGVTLEPNDGNPSHQGPKVLAAVPPRGR